MIWFDNERIAYLREAERRAALSTPRRHPLAHRIVYTLMVGTLLFVLFALAGCATVEKTMGSVDYACVDITIDTTVSDSGILGRGIVLPEGESLTAETVDLLCNY